MPVTRHESTPADRADIWAQIAAPVPAEHIQWRQNGRAITRDGKFIAPFVAYIDAQFVRERLDSVVPGEWDLTLELLPALPVSPDGEVSDEPCAFKARITILGDVREDVGTGRDYKTASTDAFKRAAVRFGIAHELYTDYEILWVQVDGDGKYAKPVEDPADVYARKLARGANGNGSGEQRLRPTNHANTSAKATGSPAEPNTPAATASGATDEPTCPKCGGRMWDNRLSKRNPKAPDYKCRSRSCDGVIWPSRGLPDDSEMPSAFDEPPDQLPF